MVTGTVKSFDLVYGTGFITPDDGSKDVYVSHSAIESEGPQELKEGQRVTFEIKNGSAFRFAKRVQILSLDTVLMPA